MSKGSRGRLRVFFAEFDGEDATLQEGLRAISQAVNKTFQSPMQIRQLPPQTTGAAAEGDDEPQDNGLFDMLGNELDHEPVHIQPKNIGKSKRKLPSMLLVKELDLHPNAKQSLRDFYTAKNPGTQYEQLSVFVYYLRNVIEAAAISANHIFTCYKDVEVRPPNDIPQILRNCARVKGWVDTRDSANIEITTQGTNLVDHDLPRKN